MRTSWNWMKRRLRRGLRVARVWALRVLFQPAEPEKIALGAAVGVFVATVPALGFQMLLAIFLATLLKANRLAAAAFVWVTNPLFFYAD